MQAVKSLLLICATGAALVVAGPGTAWADGAVPLGTNANECDISMALGVTSPGCVKKQRTRGLSIGGADQMQVPPTPQPATAHAGQSASFQINFEFASARLSSDATQILDRIGAVLTAPDAAAVKFRIAGHTDGVGSASRNQKLSLARAEAVKAYLTEHFAIDGSRLQAIGKGSRELINKEDPGAAVNRRVEITNLGG